MLVLGIESSCDETGIAVYDYSSKQLLANVLYSQINIHERYGGVVPELASREHLSKINSLTKKIIRESNINLQDIDCIAYTARPGLIGSLMVGASFAKTLGLIYNIDTIAINHLEGHLLSPFLDSNIDITYPFIALIVSGSHTQLFEVKNFNQYYLLGESIDDALGESFDKIAKFLGMKYPGGTEIENLSYKAIDKYKYKLPRPMRNHCSLNFSFSGLKTSVINIWKNEYDYSLENKANLCYAFQDAVIDVLIFKCLKALERTKNIRLVISGGVSANKVLRKRLNLLSKNNHYQVLFPPIKYCTDNAAMIALAGAYRYINGFKDVNLEINVNAKSLII